MNLGLSRLHETAFSSLLVRVGCAGVLLVAAGFKTHELLTDPTLGTLHGSRLGHFALIQYEVLLASWLLSGVYQKCSRWVTFITFGTFACYTLYLGLTGAQSCGCLGSVRVNPWLTFAFDALVIGALLAWRPTGSVVVLRRITIASAVAATLTVVLMVALLMAPRAVVGGGIVWNMGQIDPAKQRELTHAFEIPNPTDRPVSIDSVRPDCGCLLADQIPSHIEPFGTATIPVRYVASPRPGRSTGWCS